MPRTRKTKLDIISPTNPECVNKECAICMTKIRVGQAAIKLENERRCYHSTCISDYYKRGTRRGAVLKTPRRNDFSRSDINRIRRFSRVMNSKSMSRSRSRTRSSSRNQNAMPAAQHDRMIDELQFLRGEAQHAYNLIESPEDREAFLGRYADEDADQIRSGLWAHAA